MLTTQQRDLIAAAFGSAVDETVVEHYPALTQEHQLMSRIAQRLEDRLDGLQLAGVQVRVDAQELPDKGPNSLERKIGADMFVSVTVEGELSKGFLVQAKWRDARDLDNYARQCEQMISHSPASYSWEFGATGVRVFSARSIVKRAGHPAYWPRGPFEFGRKLPTMMGRFLICKEGDEDLGVPSVLNRRGYIKQMLTEWGIRRSVDVIVSKVG